MKKTYNIQVTGRVQGVGFRPFVYNLVQRQDLKGYIMNNVKGVLISVNATQSELTTFLENLRKTSPANSTIDDISYEEVSKEVFKEFTIQEYDKTQHLNLPLTPDFAICEECKKEIQDKHNRRFNYAFTSCLNCGPRYSITKDFPFERHHTSMSRFTMCEQCLMEYLDPASRRFHSQTNSCKECGIKIWGSQGESSEGSDVAEDLIRAAQYIQSGKILAIRNTNGYLLCCDAENTVAIKRLREGKNRPKKPFAVMFPSLQNLTASFNLSVYEEEALDSEVAPIVILDTHQHKGKLRLKDIAPDLNSLGVMLPSSSVFFTLLDKLNKPIVATSGNIHGSPIIDKIQEAEEKLSPIADYFVHHNLEITFPQDDSVMKFVEDQPITIRRSRGLAPNYFPFNKKSKDVILAMGSHLKSSFAYSPNSYCYLSQYFGNLDDYEVLARYEDILLKYLQMFQMVPNVILCDDHPTYQSSILGRELSIKYNATLVNVQHHKAHFAAVLAEHGLFGSDEKILGVIWDGVGLGDDGNVWGGEFFVFENRNIERVNHFEYYDWLSGDKMAQEPRLSLLSLSKGQENDLVRVKFSKEEYQILNSLLERNTLKTSSVGRLFDAVASGLNLVDINSYKSEAAMRLEACATQSSTAHPVDYLEGEVFEKIPSKLIMNKLIEDVESKVPSESIAFNFIFTLANCIITIAKRQKTPVIACSGGVFQNSILIRELKKLSVQHNIDIKFNRNLSSNDENLSIGQMIYYLYIHQEIKEG